jgi:hypothetical protein
MLGNTLPEGVRTLVLVMLAAFGLGLVGCAKLARVRLLPQFNRETDRRLLERGPLWWALSNGALLGLAFTSRLGTWLWYVVPVAAFASGEVAQGAAVYGTYGFLRLAVPALLAALAKAWKTADVSACVFPVRPKAMAHCDVVFALVSATLLVSTFA